MGLYPEGVMGTVAALRDSLSEINECGACPSSMTGIRVIRSRHEALAAGHPRIAPGRAQKEHRIAYGPDDDSRAAG